MSACPCDLRRFPKRRRPRRSNGRADDRMNFSRYCNSSILYKHQRKLRCKGCAKDRADSPGDRDSAPDDTCSSRFRRKGGPGDTCLARHRRTETPTPHLKLLAPRQDADGLGMIRWFCRRAAPPPASFWCPSGTKKRFWSVVSELNRFTRGLKSPRHRFSLINSCPEDMQQPVLRPARIPEPCQVCLPRPLKSFARLAENAIWRCLAT